MRIKNGNWPSELTADLIISDSTSIDECKQTANAIYYIERRPQQAGRCVIVKYENNTATDLLPEPYSTRTRVHEYGGGSYCIADDADQSENLYFVNDADQDIYQLSETKITRITNCPDRRFADFIFDAKHNRLISVCEQHKNNDVINTIISIDVNNSVIQTLIQGSDFYASPRLNSKATQLCWQSWNHPNMPWDGNQLWLCDIDKHLLGNKRCIAGGDEISTFQPQWSPDDILYFISDDTDWWHIYRHIDNSNQQLTFGEKEFGLPQWVFAQSTYAFTNNNTIICVYHSAQGTQLARLAIDINTELEIITTDWQSFSSISACQEKLCFIAASAKEFPQLLSASLCNSITDDNKLECKTKLIKSTCQLPLTDDYYSQARSINFINRHQQQVHANYYPPCNPEIKTPDGIKPPLIVICHGGPSGQAGLSLDPKKQFWTSRGFALLDVNYSGSTGFGRCYRNRLDKSWGELDMQDCCDAALHAVAQGLADSEQLIIRGSSAGGLTVLSALTFEDVFSAGASYYGISELSSLATDTHKFESRYLDRLIGPYPEDKELYKTRSPINSTEKLNCPVIFFQGIEDRVVPKQQAEQMFAALDKKGVCVAAQYFENEQHGFRQAETIKQTLENGLRFYQLIFNLKTEGDVTDGPLTFEGHLKIRNIKNN